MAKVVREIMNPELFALTIDAGADETVEAILDLGISAVPVLDANGRPIGMTSLRDLVRGPRRVSTPALTVAMNASIEDAAETMIEGKHHHLVVVGSDGVAVGMLSSLDLVRALVGRPAQHPAGFPHFDVGATWSDPHPLDEAHLNAAPNAPGVLVLSSGSVGHPEIDRWAEATDALRERLASFLIERATDAKLAGILERGDLRFRYAPVSDPARRFRLARVLRERIEGAPPPSSPESPSSRRASSTTL